jgi:transcriptional regulator with XRE-family HTH domain
MSRLGQLLEGARTSLALSQGALAGLLGVRQQTVSRWEQGISRPRPAQLAKLAETLGLDVAELAAASETASSSGSAARMGGPGDDTAPTRPLTPMLPFHRLTPENFERVVADLMERRYPGAKVSQLGSRGDDQRGFDVLIVLPDGHRIGVQCKREQQFGPMKVRKAVEAAELEVDESFLALARVATAEARFEMDQHARWQLWDLADLSRLVRLLEPEAAYQVVHTYFPDHVEAFLGIKPSSPWRTAGEYYRSSSHTLLDHRQALAGRTRFQLVDEIVAWINDPGAAQIAMVVGRGGLGKSKLLWEVASRAETTSVQVRFLSVGQQPAAADFERLPRGGSLVVALDDAHDIDRVAGIISQLWYSRPHAKIILAMRPYGKAEFDTEIWRLNQAPRNTKQWELNDLTQIEAAELVASLTSRPIHDSFTQQLAAVSRDCPFIAVVAADLYRRGELEGQTFVSNAALRSDVFKRFASQMTGSRGGSDAAERRSVLAALAIFQPVRLDDPDFEAAVSGVTGITSWDVVNGHIRELEDAGLVLRRGGIAVRVIPDMFADVLVANAAYDDRSGQLTSFLSHAQQPAAGAALQHLLVNASRIDWQVRDGSQGRANVVENLWAALGERLFAGSFDEQFNLLGLVAQAAFFQPDLALQLVDRVLASYEGKSAPAAASGYHRAATPADVVHATVPVLRNVAYHREFLRPALEKLWMLAQDDRRTVNQHPEHPLRVLQELAGLHTGKPLFYIDTIIDAAEEWLTKPSQLSPFDVIEPVLAVVGSDEVFSGTTLTFYSFGIDPDLVRPVRQRVVDLAFRQAESSDVPTAVRAIKTLERAITGPTEIFNRPVTDNEQQRWAQVFLPIIERLGHFGADPHLDPAIRLAIRDALSWHANYSSTATKKAAQAALASLATTIEDDLAACLHAGWGQITMQNGRSWEEAERAQWEEFSRVAAAISEGRGDQEILERLEHRLWIQRRSSDPVDESGLFMANFLAGRLSAATLLCERVLAGNFPELTAFTAIAISALANAGDPGAMMFALSMLGTDDAKLQWNAALGLFRSRSGREGFLPGEDTVLGVMAAHDNPDVRTMAGHVVFSMSVADKAAALDLLAKIEFRGSKRVASAALSGFIVQRALTWSDTAPTLRESVQDQLVALSSIDTYELMGALSELSLDDPLGVTRLLMTRIDRQTELRSLNYDAIPDRWSPALRIQQTTELARCLAEVRDWMTSRSRDHIKYQFQDDGAALYKLVAGDWNDQALATLSDFGDAPSEASLITAARVLAHAPVTVLFSQARLIANLLHHAESLSEESAELVLRTLLTTSGVFATWVGRPSQKEEQELKQARQIAKDMPRGSAERRFFEQLAERIEARLNWTADRSLPQSDGREW